MNFERPPTVFNISTDFGETLRLLVPIAEITQNVINVSKEIQQLTTEINILKQKTIFARVTISLLDGSLSDPQKRLLSSINQVLNSLIKILKQCTTEIGGNNARLAISGYVWLWDPSFTTKLGILFSSYSDLMSIFAQGFKQ
jgi:hypothetical protein